MRKKCPYSELFWSVFSRIRTDSFSPYSVQMQENTDQNNCEYVHFSRSVQVEKCFRPVTSISFFNCQALYLKFNRSL